MSDSKVIGKPTSGPWHRDEYGCVVDKSGEPVSFRTVSILCSGSPERIAEAEANTTLATASHDLLEALEWAMKCGRLDYQKRTGSNNAYCDAVDRARSAIARARGLSQ